MVTKSGGEWTASRVHPEKDEHTMAQVTKSDERQTGVPPAGLAPSLSKIELAKPSAHGAFDAVVLPDPDQPSETGRQTWKLLAKTALLFGAFNPKDHNVIDIYHAPKVGTSRFMIHPNSKFRRLWDVTTAGLVLYVITMIPMMVGFTYVDWSCLNAFNSFIDVYFVIDMVMTIRTGYFSNGEVIMDHQAILHHYLRSWFIIDLISNFPLSLFVQNSARKSIKIVKLQKLPKLLRVGRLLKYLKEYAKYYNLALSFIALVMGLHLFACLWANLFSECFDGDGEPICDDSEMPRMYIQCIHNIVLMFIGIAESTTYSQISHLLNPHTNANVEVYCVSVSVFLFGMVFSSFLFGNILSLLMSWDQQSAQFRNRMDIISAEMRYYELPEELQVRIHRVRRNYDYLWINQRAYSDMMLLNQPGISKTLRTTIALHLYKDLVKTVPFFAGSDHRFLGKVCLALETAVYLPGDTIIFCDDIGKEMFIVRKGLVEILIPEPGNPEKRIYLRDGNFFGETALVIDVRRTNTVKAVSICDLNVLNKSAFNEIVAEYPEFGERMKRTVIKRQLDNMNIQSPVEKMKVQNQLNMVVEKSLKQRRMSVSLKTIYRAKKLGDKLKEIADRASRANNGTTRRLSRLVPGRRTSGAVVPPPVHTPGRKIRPDPIETTDFGQHSGSSFMPPPLEPANSKSRNAPLGYTLTASASSQHVTASASPPQLSQQGSSINIPGGGKIRLSQIDAVSRKLNKAELTLDLIPTALTEITTMVNQIKRTTDRLNRRIHQTSDVSSDDDDFDLTDFESQINLGVDGDEQLDPLPPITTLNEDYEEEMARRESNSVYTPRNMSTSTASGVLQQQQISSDVKSAPPESSAQAPPPPASSPSTDHKPTG
uniref:Cyclic nucleotide-binding domain-containing protein n=1 Tax=Globisporangium ultimum (strain ATCC 200006 / CBS 805.95 / DAOM BR144) TaxID=431595 RepID=K3WMP6_GLOUD